MQIWEVILIGVALAMDAVAVSLTNGMCEPKMRFIKMFAIAITFAAFQFAMPVAGYYFSSVFSSIVEEIAPWLSFALLGFIGGKMIFDGVREMAKKKKWEFTKEGEKRLGMGKLLVQGVATSLDALAVGVTLLAAETTSGLPFHAVLCAAVIGAVTFALSLPAVAIGKKAGDTFSDKAELIGGIVLVLIGVKILIEGLI